jgi:hypothetical protein
VIKISKSKRAWHSQIAKKEKNMRALNILKRNVNSFLAQTIHAARLKTLYWAASVLIGGNRLSVTALGRDAHGSAFTKHNIKRVDRFVGNKHFHKEIDIIYAGLANLLISRTPRPILCVDWTPVGENHYALVASVPVDGRALPVYEEVYEKKYNNKHSAHKRFLKNLNTIIPLQCCPIIVTDAGFKNPWFKEVLRYGWDFLGRTGSNTKTSKGESGRWIKAKELMEKAGTRAKVLGKWILAKSNPVEVNLILGKKVPLKRRRKSSTKKKRKPATAAQRKSRQRALEPWLLATSLVEETAKSITKLYAKRMQIEEMFRDTKNHRFGWCFEDANSKTSERLRVLLLIAAVAMIAVTLVGQTAERRGMERRYQANTIRKRRVLSLFVLGVNLIRREHDAIFTENELRQSFAEIRSKFGWLER